jgi:hypothetical protein
MNASYRHELTHVVLALPLVVRWMSSRTEAPLGPIGCTHPDIDLTPSTLSLLFHSPSILPHKPTTMDSSKRVASDGVWDRLPEDIVSLIASKVAEISEASLEDLCSLHICNKATKRASSSRGVANHFNLEHHYQATVWRHGDTHAVYLQTIDWLLGVSNGQALFVKGMGNLCTSQPDGVALLERAVDERDLQATYVLAVLNYYKHDATDHVFNLIRRVCGEVPLGLQVARQLWSDEGIHDEDEACIARVRYRVQEEIGCVLWREHLHLGSIYELHHDDQQCMRKKGCGNWWVTEFCSLRCRIRQELAEFLTRFPLFRRLLF